MLTAYGQALLVAVAGSALLLAVMMRHSGLHAALQTVLLCILLGVMGARAYYILTVNLLGGYPMYGGLLSRYPYEHAMCGAVLGVCLALALSARLSLQSTACLLDAAAPAGLVMIALARFAEGLSDFGWGAVAQQALWQRAPLCVQDLFGQWHWSVFVLEGVLALVVLALVTRGRKQAAGLRFSLALLWWSVTQIFCESFRVETIRWGFVRVQQVQCALFALGVLLVWNGRRGIGVRQLLRQLALFAACTGVVIFAEFALDKLNMLPNAVLYAMMAAALLGMGLLAQNAAMGRAARRAPRAGVMRG